jgi:ribosome-associated toxin RatA of RatAB toxin-antitoxin module
MGLLAERERRRNMRMEQAQVVKAPREQVYQTWIDYEAWPTFSGFFTRVTVTQRSGNTVIVEVEVKVMGRRSKGIERHELTPPERIEVRGEAEGATNRTVWTFESVPEGTLLTAVWEADLKGVARVLGPFAQRRLRSLLREWMQGLARHAEAG